MNSFKLVGAGVIALGLSVTSSFAATLIGDDVTISGLFPDLNTVNRSGIVTVNAGNLDRVTFGGGSFAHADALQVSFIAPNVTTFGTGSTGPDGGNFIRFDGLDFDDGSILSGVSLDSTFGGIVLADIDFGDDFVQFNVSGISPMAGDSIVVGLQTSAVPMSAVPLPAGGLLMLSGLAGFAAFNRRKKQST